ncbi:MAG: tRNA pseudouridine synthase A, partial [Mycobacteriales bacterium]
MAYDGTAYAGWARQPGRETVQGTVEAALATVLRLTEPPAVTVAGRTDAGVHALGQVAHVDIPAGPGVERLARRLNGALRPDVRVGSVRVAPAGFDARFSALCRRYAYRIADPASVPNPLRRWDTLAHPKPLEMGPMRTAAAALLG